MSSTDRMHGSASEKNLYNLKFYVKWSYSCSLKSIFNHTDGKVLKMLESCKCIIFELLIFDNKCVHEIKQMVECSAK